MSNDGWVAVTDGLPEDDTRVIVYRKAAHRGTDPEFGFQRCHHSDKYPLGQSVTHWRPIPAAPKS